ncbi:hypothetical protein KC887_00340 [Candidatus Kaiserbacteria bacterium]|nr:hypothetical protein [Candidatus Kaiserbacteria bacterium]
MKDFFVYLKQEYMKPLAKHAAQAIDHLEKAKDYRRKTAVTMVAQRFGWFNTWSHHAALARAKRQVEEKVFESHELFSIPMEKWQEYIKEVPIIDLPNPLPYIPPGTVEISATVDLTREAAELAEIQAKANIDIPLEECYKWAFRNMIRPDATIKDAPNGMAFALYQFAREQKGKFIADYLSKFGDIEKSVVSKPWMRDDKRKIMGLIKALLKEKSPRIRKKFRQA